MEGRQNKCTQLWAADRVKVPSQSPGLSFVGEWTNSSCNLKTKTSRQTKGVNVCVNLVAAFELVLCFLFSFFFLPFVSCIEQGGFWWVFKTLKVVSPQWDPGPSNPSPGGLFLSTKPVEIQCNRAEPQHLCSVTVPLVFRTFCSSAEGLPCPGCLSQPQTCLILSPFRWNQLGFQDNRSSSSLLRLLLLEVLQPPRGGCFCLIYLRMLSQFIPASWSHTNPLSVSL